MSSIVDSSSGIIAVTGFPNEWYFPTGEAAIPGVVPEFDSYLPNLDVQRCNHDKSVNSTVEIITDSDVNGEEL